jgi:hypothetical protein
MNAEVGYGGYNATYLSMAQHILKSSSVAKRTTEQNPFCRKHINKRSKKSNIISTSPAGGRFCISGCR